MSPTIAVNANWVRSDLPPSVRRELDRVERDLVREYRGHLHAATVREYVSDALTELGHVKVMTFVPVLVLRAVRLRASSRLSCSPVCRPRTPTRRS